MKMFRATLEVLIFALLLTNSTVAAPDNTAEYRIVFSAEDRRSANIEAELTVTDGKLRMAPWGHPYLPEGWATFVSDLRITDLLGVPIRFEKAGGETWGAWHVDASDGMRVKLSYKAEFTQDQFDWNEAGGQDSRPSVSDAALFLVTKALFIYSPAVAAATVEIVVPDQWIISSPWPAVDGRNNLFTVNSWISLINNALVVGEHVERVVSDGNMQIVLAMDAGLSESADLFEQTFRKQLGAYRTLFGGTPESKYLVTLRLADEDDGESFENSFNQVITPGRIEQRSIVWANTMGHELFHYWNGNHVLIGADKPSIEWFGEGFTEYYASLTLYRTGLISESLWHSKLETFLGRYVVTTSMWPVETVSLADAGKEKHKNWLRIYGGGATMALILDIEIRSATAGDKGLDDVMRLMKDRFGKPGARYQIDDILAAVNIVSGADFTGFFEAHIMGTEERLEIAATLQKAGIHTEQFSDEFYLSRMSNPSPLQHAIYTGITTID